MLSRRRGARMATAALALAATAACASAGARETAPATAPGMPAATHTGAHAGHGTAPAAPAAASARHDEADARFMQHMIAHHGQALIMTELVPARTARQEIRLLAQRIEVSQQDEIVQMQRWLRAHGAAVPEPVAAGAHAAHGEHASMPGMLSAAELARLGTARGAEFDRLFLEYMIRHHEGALVMVAELFASPSGGQDPNVFRIASEVDSDQRMEIARMQRVLGALAGPAQPR